MHLFCDVKDRETALGFSDLGNGSACLICERGELIILLNDSIYNLKKDAICIIPPFSSLRFVKMSVDLDCWITEMDMKDLADAVLEVPDGKKMDISNEPCRRMTENQREGILGLKKVMEERCAAVGRDGFSMVNNVIRSLRKAFCYEAVQAFVYAEECEEVPANRKKEIFYRFLESVKLRFASEKNISYYAEEQGLNPAYLSSVVKDVSGQPAKFWIENLTFTSAIQYLRNRSFSIGKIAWILNFPDQSSFGKYFKKISGYSPAGFRKKYL